MPADAENLIMPIIPDHARKQLVEMGESDFSYAIAGVGRYRVNAFRQRGSYACVIRIVGTRIPSPQELGLPESVVAHGAKKRPRHSNRPDRLRKINDARVTRRCHKLNAERECHHAGGPDRVPAQTQ